MNKYDGKTKHFLMNFAAMAGANNLNEARAVWGSGRKSSRTLTEAAEDEKVQSGNTQVRCMMCHTRVNLSNAEEIVLKNGTPMIIGRDCLAKADILVETGQAIAINSKELKVRKEALRRMIKEATLGQTMISWLLQHAEIPNLIKSIALKFKKGGWIDEYEARKIISYYHATRVWPRRFFDSTMELPLTLTVLEYRALKLRHHFQNPKL